MYSMHCLWKIETNAFIDCRMPTMHASRKLFVLSLKISMALNSVCASKIRMQRWTTVSGALALHWTITFLHKHTLKKFKKDCEKCTSTITVREQESSNEWDQTLKRRLPGERTDLFRDYQRGLKMPYEHDKNVSMFKRSR